jgi:hypothetical protein
VLVRPEVARAQMDAELAQTAESGVVNGIVQTDVTTSAGGVSGMAGPGGKETVTAPEQQLPRRYHGAVSLDSTRVGRDAGRIAEDVIAHLTALVGAEVRVTLEIEADIPAGVPDHVVRTVTENGRTLKFTSHGFERE